MSFGIKGRGTVVTGRIERGRRQVRRDVEIIGFKARPARRWSRASRCSRRPLDEGRPARQRRLPAARHRARRHRARSGAGQARPRSSHTPSSTPRSTSCPRKRVAATRRSSTATGPQFYIRTTDVTGAIELPDGVEMVMPGDNVQMKIELITPVALEDGLRFAIREGGRTVGAGVDHLDHGVARRHGKERIRIRLKASTTGCSTSRRPRSSRRPSGPGAARGGPVPLPTRIEKFTCHPLAVHRQGLARGVRDPTPAAARRHPRSECQDRRRPDASFTGAAGVDIEIKMR